MPLSTRASILSVGAVSTLSTGFSAITAQLRPPHPLGGNRPPWRLAQRPAVGDTGEMTGAGGRSAPAGMKVGGQALPDGVLMRTDRAWAVARADGTVVTGELPPPRLPRIPVVRVLASLAQGLRLGLTRPRRAGTDGRRSRDRTWALWRALAGAEAAVLGLDWLAGRLRPPVWG